MCARRRIQGTFTDQDPHRRERSYISSLIPSYYFGCSDGCSPCHNKIRTHSISPTFLLYQPQHTASQPRCLTKTWYRASSTNCTVLVTALQTRTGPPLLRCKYPSLLEVYCSCVARTSSRLSPCRSMFKPFVIAPSRGDCLIAAASSKGSSYVASQWYVSGYQRIMRGATMVSRFRCSVDSAARVSGGMRQRQPSRTLHMCTSR
jgi:hypothetical protein